MIGVLSLFVGVLSMSLHVPRSKQNRAELRRGAPSTQQEEHTTRVFAVLLEGDKNMTEEATVEGEKIRRLQAVSSVRGKAAVL
jgi:hypothetical protein